LFVKSTKAQITVTDANAHADTLARNPLLGNLLSGKLSKIPMPPAVTDTAHPFALRFDDNSMSDLWVATTWGK